MNFDGRNHVPHNEGRAHHVTYGSASGPDSTSLHSQEQPGIHRFHPDQFRLSAAAGPIRQDANRLHPSQLIPNHTIEQSRSSHYHANPPPDRSAAAIQHLLETVSKQQNEIRFLTTELRRLSDHVGSPPSDPKTYDVDGNFSNNANEKKYTAAERGSVRESLSKRLEKLEAPILTPDGVAVPMPESITSFAKRLDALERILNNKADWSIIESRTLETKQLIKDITDKLGKELASQSSMCDLGESFVSLASKLETIEIGLTNKVDKVDLNLLKHSAGIIKDHREFMLGSEARVASMESGLAKSAEGHNNINCQLAELKIEINRATKDHANKVSVLDAVEKLRFDVDKLTEDSTKADFQALKNNLDLTAPKVKEISRELSAISNRLQEIENSQESHTADVYSKQEINNLLGKFVARSKLQSAMNEVREEMQDSKTVEEVEKLKLDLQNLSKEYQKTKEASELATKFIKWYSRRGSGSEPS